MNRVWLRVVAFVVLASLGFAAIAGEQPRGGPGAVIEPFQGEGDRERSAADAVTPHSQNVFGDIRMSGPVTYNMTGSTIQATIASLTNASPLYSSGTLRVRIFVTTTPINGPFTFWTVGEFALIPTFLNAGQQISLVVGVAPILAVPNGIYYMHIGVFEWERPGSCGNSVYDYCIDDFITFNGRVQSANGFLTNYVPPPPPPTQPIFPETGVWWDPSQSGNGYVVSIKNGVLVMQIYSYRPDGQPQWYLTAGPTANGNRNYLGTLDKYSGGQCISCPGWQAPTHLGNDGTISVTFNSPTSATVRLPGGRVSNIVPFAF